MTNLNLIQQSPELNCQNYGHAVTSKTRQFLITSAIVFLATAFGSAAQADLAAVSGDVASGTGQITINNDITFDINSTGNVLTMVFDEWTTTDGTPNLASIAGDASVFGYSINSGGTLTTNSRLRDNFGTTLGEITPNDGYLTFETLPAVVPGDTLTVKAGTYALDAAPGFNPSLNDFSFSGSAFLTNTAGIRISNIVVGVPEPSSVLLLGACGFGWLARRGKDEWE